MWRLFFLTPPCKAAKPLAARRERDATDALPSGGKGIVEAIIETAKAIKEAFRGDWQTQEGARESLRNTFEQSEIRRAIQQAFSGTGNGPFFNVESSRVIIHEAVLAAFSSENLEDTKEILLRIYTDGDLKQSVSERGHGNCPKVKGLGDFREKRAKKDYRFKTERIKTERTGDFIEYIFLQMQLHVYSQRMHHNDILHLKAPKHKRRLQVGPIFADLVPDDAFTCPEVSGCYIPRSLVNDRKCDCPGTCADETSFTCDSCVPRAPFGGPQTQTATSLGVALGVSLGVALGVGLGVGLGLTGVGVYLAEGSMQIAVNSAQEFSSNPQVQQAMKDALTRLASSQIPTAAVQLIWGCALDAFSSRKLRQLAEVVNLCFEIEVQGEKESVEVCSSLGDTPLVIAANVINEELEQSGRGKVQIVQWSPNPNPRSKLPGQAPPLPLTNSGVNLGWDK